ncbi:Clavaminate synthase-like protein [Auriculariales sp. MPI-PUGE-AT-0066]|nr:Clavaminate synthase-like protein [Auriculariales sp. MPI-PUGE-AT-0066]
MSNRYKNDDFPRCLSCTRRWAGDTCRFQGVRLFYRNGSGELRGIDFVTALVTPSPEMMYPTAWNAPLTPRHVRLVKEVAARGLLHTLHEEEEHVQKPNIVRRQRETDCRATCDTCLTAIFAGSWICTSCGRESCSACHDKVAEICADPKKKKQTLDASPFFLTCTKKQEHTLANFRPITRFGRQEIQDALYEMRAFIPADEEQLTGSLLPGPSLNRFSSSPVPLVNGAHREKRRCPPLPAQALGTVNYKDVRLFHHKDLNDANFCELWEKGTPLVVEGLHEKTTLRWTPEYLMEKHGGEQCLVVECQNDSNRRLTVEEFFKKFGNYEDRNEILKLKDWPSSTDFKSAFPVLYEDFMDTVPMPDYSRRDGVLNISSHFPFNSVGPDLGPKMYNAFASNLDPGSKGSTRLHMDVADAVNMMQYCEPRPDGGDGGAVWDIFAAEDTPKIRNFLKTLSTGKHQTTIDPIHGQTHYLDSGLMQQLYDEEGVTSYRIFQRPGQAVFIPAGCAHQVCNLADCIKVAVDFVSPQNIVRCERLTREFREQNQAQLWKEDMLQLKTMLWYAWLSSSRYGRLPSAPPPLRQAFELPANVPLPVTAAGGRMQIANLLPREPSSRMAISSLLPHQPQAGPSSSTA